MTSDAAHNAHRLPIIVLLQNVAKVLVQNPSTFRIMLLMEYSTIFLIISHVVDLAK